ncbi:MAG: hypothetical protein NTW96_25500 [Planctomycetia bacterium]|nr:hypothetical protein [Planctomycetia bacterium]
MRHKGQRRPPAKPEPQIGPAERQADLVRLAGEAAAAGNPKEMLQALAESLALDGLLGRLRAKWPTLHRDDLDFVIGQAVDAAYDLCRTARRVTNLLALIWKIADRRAYDRRDIQKRDTGFDQEALSAVEDHRSSGNEPDATDWEQKRAKALAIARQLLPRLGQTNLQRVVEYLLDGIEAGREDIPNAEIAEALALSPATVRQAISRGLRRLARIAKEDGLVDEYRSFPALTQGESKTEDYDAQS